MNIILENISKEFQKTIILSNIYINLVKGNVYCLLGKNGVGKTTIINLILNLVLPTSGKIKFNNESYLIIPDHVKQKIGVLSEENPVIDELTPLQYLRLIGRIYHLDKKIIEKRINDLFNYFFDELPPDRPLSTYSTGMKKKIGICAAVIHSPEVLILDEPFSGLDPIAAREMIIFIKEFANEDRLILMSSHDLSYIEEISSHIIVLDTNKIVFNDSLDVFKKNKISISQALFDILSKNVKSIKGIQWL